jgi:prefoldin beta subunit
MDQNKLQEMQLLEQNLQNLLLQKQAFQMELSEADSAIVEIEKSGEDVYKIVGQLMIAAKKDEVTEELKKKKEMLDLRIKNLEKQEEILSKKSEEIRDEIMKSQESEKKE